MSFRVGLALEQRPRHLSVEVVVSRPHPPPPRALPEAVARVVWGGVGCCFGLHLPLDLGVGEPSACEVVGLNRGDDAGIRPRLELERFGSEARFDCVFFLSDLPGLCRLRFFVFLDVHLVVIGSFSLSLVLLALFVGLPAEVEAFDDVLDVLIGLFLVLRVEAVPVVFESIHEVVSRGPVRGGNPELRRPELLHLEVTRVVSFR
mmetsp:Transcript_18017/g.32248  ORF Transcript_18017/g.32248 Transcript_18017/m.32248 type:complete len:204 (-) Transcript_18017:2538-3149(-)